MSNPPQQSKTTNSSSFDEKKFLEIFDPAKIRGQRKSLEEQLDHADGLIEEVSAHFRKKSLFPFGIYEEMREVLIDKGFSCPESGARREVVMMNERFVVKTPESVSNRPWRCVPERRFRVMGKTFIVQPKIKIEWDQSRSFLSQLTLEQREGLFGEDAHEDNVGFDQNGMPWAFDY